MQTAPTGPVAKELEAPAVGRVVRVPRSVPPKTSEPAPAAPALYVPFAGMPQAVREPWYRAFLSDLAINGGMSLAAAAAGVHRKRVNRALDDDPAFAEEVEVALAYYRDLLEWESVNLARRRNNPLPYFARLKAELPARYIDKQAVLLAGGPLELGADEGKALLTAILAHTQPQLPPAAEPTES